MIIALLASLVVMHAVLAGYSGEGLDVALLCMDATLPGHCGKGHATWRQVITMIGLKPELCVGTWEES